MKFSTLLPELMVSNFEISLDFYINVVGFKIEYQRNNPKFAFLSFQKTSQLMIQELKVGEEKMERLEHPFGRGINFQIETKNVQKIIDSTKKHNYPLKRGIKDSWYKNGKESYGCREVLVLDPDGYLLRFSEDLGKKSV